MRGRYLRSVALVILSAVALLALPAHATHNDNFLSGQVIDGSSGSVSSNNIGATMESDELNPTGFVSRTVWYRWMATTPVVTFDTCGSDYDTTLAAYTDPAPDALPNRVATVLTTVAFSDDWVVCEGETEGTGSQITFNANPGQLYHIQVGGFCDPGGRPVPEAYLGCNNQGNFAFEWHRTG